LIGDADGPSLIWAQLRKSPSAARMADAMARPGNLKWFLTSLPVKIWWSQAPVAARILMTLRGLPTGLAGSPTGPLECRGPGVPRLFPLLSWAGRPG
jgi:hypothetical protein